MHQHFRPSLVLPVIAADRNTALGGLHTISVQISIFSQFHQPAVINQTLFQQGHSRIKLCHILAPLIIQHMLGRMYFFIKEIGKLTITVHVVL